MNDQVISQVVSLITNPTKVCSKCKQEKPITEFHKNKFSKDGIHCYCKVCRTQNKAFELNILSLLTKTCPKCKTKKLIVEFNKNNHVKSGCSSYCKACEKQYRQQYDLTHKKEKKIRDHLYRLNNLEKEKLRNKLYYEHHKDEKRLYDKQRSLEQKRKKNIASQERRKKRYKNDPTFRLICLSRNRMKWALKRQGVKKSLGTIDGLGCTPEFFQTYMQSLFKTGMTLENNGDRKWVMHHIIHCSTCDLRDIEQQKKCFHYSNIIPMWEDEHILLHANDTA